MKEGVRKNTHLLGAHFENLAVEYLQAKGYSILERNARYHHLETDIIAMDGDYLCFIEVKGRKKNSLTQPLEALNRRKISFLRTMAEAYLVQHGLALYDTPCRFDCISIQGDEITLLKNVF